MCILYPGPVHICVGRGAWGGVGVRGSNVVQEHRKCFDIENPTLCHLSDDCIPTRLGTYNEMHFTGMVFIPELSTCGVPSCHVLNVV